MDAGEIARACADAMWAEDSASKGLGMQLISVEPGRAVLAMTITDKMVNGHNIAHGGFIFTLAEFDLRFRLQHLQPAHGSAAMRSDLHRSRQARRSPDRKGRRDASAPAAPVSTTSRSRAKTAR